MYVSSLGQPYIYLERIGYPCYFHDLTVVKIHGWIRRLSGTIAVKTFELTCPRDVVSSRRIPSGPLYERECFLFFRFPLKTLIIRDPQTFDHAMPAVRSKDKQASEQRP